MASQLAAAPPAPSIVPPRRAGTPLERLTRRLVRRRVAISAVLLAALVALDVLVFRRQPRDVLNLADPLVPVCEALILIGLFIRSWAAGTLRKKKELATTGPYA